MALARLMDGDRPLGLRQSRERRGKGTVQRRGSQAPADDEQSQRTVRPAKRMSGGSSATMSRNGLPTHAARFDWRRAARRESRAGCGPRRTPALDSRDRRRRSRRAPPAACRLRRPSMRRGTTRIRRTRPRRSGAGGGSRASSRRTPAHTDRAAPCATRRECRETTDFRTRPRAAARASTPDLRACRARTRDSPAQRVSPRRPAREDVPAGAAGRDHHDSAHPPASLDRFGESDPRVALASIARRRPLRALLRFASPALIRRTLAIAADSRSRSAAARRRRCNSRRCRCRRTTTAAA